MRLTRITINQIEDLHNGDTSEANITKVFNKFVAVDKFGEKIIKNNLSEFAQLSEKFIIDYDMFKEPEAFVNDMLLKVVLDHYK